MPTVEYYFYLMNAYNGGLVDPANMEEWIGQVDRQARKISDALGKRVPLERAVCQPLEGVEDYVKACVGRGEPVDYARVLQTLSQQDQLWREVLPLAKPRSWKDLNYTNYVVAVLQCARIRDGENRLTVYVENPAEQRILRKASKIARRLEKQGSEYNFRVLGIYPHEKVFLPDGNSEARVFRRLYYLTEEQLAGKSFAREIIEANRLWWEGGHRDMNA